MAYPGFRNTRSGLIRAACVMLALCSCGCAVKEKPPLQPPDARVTLTHFTGGALSGPTARVADTSQPKSALAASVRLVALEQPLRGDLLKPIDPDVRLIISDRADAPVVPVTRLTRGARWTSPGQPDQDVSQLESELAAGALGRSVEMGSFDLAVAPGATAVIRAIDGRAAASGSKRGIELSFHAEPAPADHQLQLSLAIEEQGRELAVLRSVPVNAPTPLALAIPFRYSDGRTQAVIAIVQATPGTDSPAARTALARCAEDLSRSASEAAARPSTLATSAAAWPSYEAALNALDEPGSIRPSLLYLSTETDAPACQDCALVADDAALSQLAQQVRKRASATAATTQPTTESLGWALDAATFDLLSQLQSDSKLPPELLAVFIRHAGQAAQNVGLVQEIVSGAKGRADFEQRVQAENFVALEDSSPGARVRAFDWLSARGKAPPDYDPLAPPKERRAALNKAIDAMAAQAAAAPVPAAQGGKP